MGKKAGAHCANTVVKKEGGVGCIKNRAASASSDQAENGKKLLADFNYKISKAPSQVRAFYEKNFKSAKLSNAQKVEFVVETMQTDNF